MNYSHCLRDAFALDDVADRYRCIQITQQASMKNYYQSQWMRPAPMHKSEDRRLCQKSVRVQFSTLKIRTIRTKSETMAALHIHTANHNTIPPLNKHTGCLYIYWMAYSNLTMAT